MLTNKNTCLVVIDIQEKLITHIHNHEQVVKNSEILVRIAAALNIPVLWCQQVPAALGETVSPLRSQFAQMNLEPVNKTCFSCCGSEVFAKKLAALDSRNTVLCGIESHVCVFQTAGDLIDRGLNVHVIADAVSSRTSENRQIGLNRISSAGAVISSVEMFLFELLRDSKHEKFRELAKLIK